MTPPPHDAGTRNNHDLERQAEIDRKRLANIKNATSNPKGSKTLKDRILDRLGWKL